MTPSIYQQAILTEVKSSNRNIVIDAKAGSGKTSTLKLISNILPASPDFKSLVVAFNKSIQTELAEKLPTHIEVKTCHAKGIEIIRKSTGKVRVDDKGQKMRELLDKLVQQWGLNYAEEDDRKTIDDIRELCDLCRLSLALNVDAILQVAEKHGMQVHAGIADKVLQLMRCLASNRGVVDFVDMIFLPAVFNDYCFPKYDVIMVDECQDLSLAQQAMIMKMLKPEGRFIAVGDPFQSIYGFAGADSDAFKKLQSRPNTVTLPLNECYRCGKAIIKHVQKFVPDIIAYDKNVDGEVKDGSVNDIQDGDFVLCRLTLPLVVLCYKLISENKPAHVKGRDIGRNLISMIQKSKRRDLVLLQSWLNNELDKHYQKLCKLNPALTPQDVQALSSFVTFEEKVKIIKLIIANNGEVVCADSLCNKIEKIFTDNAKGGITLSTVHKAKGLEADRVFIIEPDLMPFPRAKKAWEIEQEKNLQYVAYTRAKNLLVFVTDWTSKNERGEEPQPEKLVKRQVELVNLPF